MEQFRSQRLLVAFHINPALQTHIVLVEAELFTFSIERQDKVQVADVRFHTNPRAQSQAKGVFLLELGVLLRTRLQFS